MFSKRNVRHLGTRRQLFLDDDIIDEFSGITRRIGAVQKHPANPVLISERPWESHHPQLWGGTVLRDAAGGYRMWYQTGPKLPTNKGEVPDGFVKEIYGRNVFVINYATSPDGIHWQRPGLGLVDWDGSKDNNILLRDYDHPIVVECPDEPDPQRRYRMLCLAPAKKGWTLLSSPDGIRWTTPGVPGPHRDFGIMARDTADLFYDEANSQWVSVLKLNRRIGRWPDSSLRRCLGICTSEDGENWDVPELILTPDALDDSMSAQRTAQVPDRLTTNHPDEYFCDFQNMRVLPYEGMYIGFITVFDASGLSPAGNQDGTVRVQLAVSRDLRNWTRVADRETFIDLGAMGSFDSHMIIGPAPPVVLDDSLRIYYTGVAMSHMDGRRKFHQASPQWQAAHADHPDSCFPDVSGGIGLATIRRDGFVALEAGLGGYFRTKHFTFTGDNLYLNIANGAYGQARGTALVEIVEPDDTPIPGFTQQDCDPIRVDSVRHMVTWGGNSDISSLQDRIVRLKFHCNTTRLYSLWFEA